jgi:predicted phage terminase large subunit-like protein
VLRQEGISAVKPIKPLGDKVMRMHAQTAQIEGGFVLLPKQAPWPASYQAELITFPKGKYDDQVDSTSQALGWIHQFGMVPGIIQYYQQQVEEKRRRGQ